jgi:1,4-alpha-glucan branching enzyme
MGWMNDTLEYAKSDPIFRQYRHNNLTFSMMYAFSENYLLPISHDEVVHLKGSLIHKMPGYYDDKFAGVRSYLSYMMAHPGKKLLFMGSEIGQFTEWSEARSLDWHLLDYDRHKQLQRYVKTLNHLYLEHSEFWENDTNWEGFEWLCNDDYQGNTLGICRKNHSGGELIAIFNFSPLNRLGYRIGVPTDGIYRELLNSDSPEFGGWGNTNPHDIGTEFFPWHGKEQSFQLTLPPFGAVFLKRIKT